MDKQKAMERLNAIEKEAKALRAEIDKPEKPEPKWKSNPELLVGKLCRLWDFTHDDDAHRRLGIVYKTGGGLFEAWFGSSLATWHNAEPLTPSEIQAMTYRESRYDWSKAPDWAMWLATDPDGSINAFDYKPHICTIENNEWMRTNDVRGDRWEFLSEHNSPCPDWRDSLEHRPEGV